MPTKRIPSQPAVCGHCAGAGLVKRIMTCPVRLAGPLEGKQIHVGRVALDECEICGHLVPTPAAPSSTRPGTAPRTEEFETAGMPQTVLRHPIYTRRRMRHAILLAAAVLLASCSPAGNRSKPPSQPPEETAAKPPEPREPMETETQVEMVNVNIHLDPALILHIRHLAGKFLPARKGQPPAFDDKLSYVVAIDSAEVGVSMASMTHAMNTYVFGEPDAPLKDLQLSAAGSQIRQKGTLKKGIGIPFEMVGTMSATPDGKIRIHPTQTKAAHLPVGGLLKLFGLDMAKLINTRKTRGIRVDDNDMILDPGQMLPPPKLRGRITAVRVQGGQIIQVFGKESRDSAPKPPGSNYIAYRGGVLRFGRLTMTNADMRLIDADPTDPFDFFPDHYKDQLVAGYSKTTASGGLLVYMPDYNKISKSLSPR